MLLTRQQILLLIVLTICWGANWPVMKLAVGAISPLHYRAVTMAVGAGIILCWILYRGLKLKVGLPEFGGVLVLCIPNVILWHTFSIYGVTELASGRAAILGFTMPIWAALLGALILKQKLTSKIWISIVAVMVSIILLTWSEQSTLSGRPVGIIWMQIAAFSWGLGTVLFGKIKLQAPIEVTTFWMLAISVCALTVVAMLFEPAMTWEYDSTTWFTLFYGAVINFGIGQLIWFSMARSLPPTASSFSVMAIPVVSIFSAALLLGESPQTTDFIAVICIIVAISSALHSKKPKAINIQVEEEREKRSDSNTP